MKKTKLFYVLTTLFILNLISHSLTKIIIQILNKFQYL